MKITITGTDADRNRKVTVQVASDDLDIHKIIEILSDALMAWGFNSETVNRALGKNESMD